MDLYCLRCKVKTPTTDLSTVTTKNKRIAHSGKCSICGRKKFSFLPKKTGGDIATLMSKFPGTPWAKYPGEKHLPGYNYCGPGTRLDIRLDDQDQPKSGEYPVNAIDKACHVHDVAYKSKDLEQRHIADVKLLHALNSIKNKNLKESLANWLVKSAMKTKLAIGAG